MSDETGVHPPGRAQATAAPTALNAHRPWLDLRRMLRYSAVSAVTVPLSQVALTFFLVVLDWSPVVSNFAAVSGAAVPSYLLNRSWVWSKRDKSSLRREILPFWAMVLLGLAISSVLTWCAGRWFETPFAVNAASLIGFGLVWAAKYFVLDAVLFGEREPSSAAC